MIATLVFTTKIDDVLVDVGTLTLSDPTATYGIKRNDNDAIVVAAGTVVSRISTGTFQFQFEEPAEDIWYTVQERWVYEGEAHYVEHTYFASHAGDSRIPEVDRIALVGAVVVSPLSVFQGQRPQQFYSVE